MQTNTFGAKAKLRVGSAEYEYFRLQAVEEKGVGNVGRLPFSIRILLENLLRSEDGHRVAASDIEYVARGQAAAESKEISFMPARVLLQDFTGVPAVVDLAAMRDALAAAGADPSRANPLMPADLVIDHSVQVDSFGSAGRFRDQRGAGIRAQPRALRAAALGANRVPQLPRRAARHGHRAPGESRIPGIGGVPQPMGRPIRIRWSAPIRTPP